MTRSIMSWASWLSAQAKNSLLPVWMPAYRQREASNTALQSSPPPRLPSSPATKPSSSLEKNHRPSSPITTVVVCPPHRPGQTPTCSPQVPESFLLPARQAYYGLPVASNRALESPPASDTSSFFSCTPFSLATTPSSSPEKENHPSVPLTTVVVRPPHQQCPGKSQTRSPVPKNIDSPPPPYPISSPSSFFSCPSSSPPTTPSSSPESEHQPSSQLTTGVVRPPRLNCPGQSLKHFPVPENVDSPSSQSICDGDSAEPSPYVTTLPAAIATPLQQADSTNQPDEYPPPFNQILAESGLGKTLLSANFSALVAMVVLLDKNESIGLWGRVVCLLLLLSSLALFFALLLKELYPAFASVTVLVGIGCSIAAICGYPLSVFLPHFWVTVLSMIVALSVMTPIMIIFCLKKYDRAGGIREGIERGDR